MLHVPIGQPPLTIQPRFAARTSLYSHHPVQCRAVDNGPRPDRNVSLCTGARGVRASVGGDCVPGLPPAVSHEIHAGVVVDLTELRRVCISTFQCTKNATAYFSWSGDGCDVFEVEESAAVHAPAQSVEWLRVLGSHEVKCLIFLSPFSN